MFPYIHLNLHFWHPEIPTFGLMLWLAAVAAAFVMDRGFKRAQHRCRCGGHGGDRRPGRDCGRQALARDRYAERVSRTGLAGAVGYGRVCVVWRTGLRDFGAGVSGLVGKDRRLRTLDLAAPAAAIGYGIGRIGCFLSGDGCYGIETKLPWGMSFPNGIEPTPPGVRVHPTPLYELGMGLLIGWYLWWRGGKKHGTGAIVGEYLVLSGIARFLVEFIRRNPKVLWGCRMRSWRAWGLFWWAPGWFGGQRGSHSATLMRRANGYRRRPNLRLAGPRGLARTTATLNPTSNR